ncbi:hypothetical protein PR202_ga14800 [Eleusine coracana subsp. coracana]|uniref:Uncharacterized protein n=1 Tax=Eleusine coracana subsp. coracana TaxID=191504 RepID=A0AAV5CI81_ELECO|nr:hypothetical protein PR202_ga14800 [Eleusine coracana subsp. coracana]
MGGEEGTARITEALRSFMAVLVHADCWDVALMVLGLLGAVGDGMAMPVVRLLLYTRMANDIGQGPDLVGNFTAKLNANAMDILLVACASWFTAFLEGYCWARTAERQASRMRARYLGAVLRQDMEYLDLKQTGGSVSEVVTSVSNDALIVQDVLGEKVPSFLTSAATFAGSCAVALALLWRLALVTLPFVALLVVPGFAYARALTGLARDRYARPGAVAEQAVSNVRTVYAFAAEPGTMDRFGAALEEAARVGVKQGLVKGVAIGTSAICFVVTAFNLWYGSRLVMYHGYQGGTVFIIAMTVIIGGHAGVVPVERDLLRGRQRGGGEDPGGHPSGPQDRLEERRRRDDRGVSGEVEFRSVDFCYPSRPDSPVLAGFSLLVPAGHTVALVGSSGSGKSTVIRLLERFYDPSAGLVSLDGVDIRRLKLNWLRAQMGLVSQEPALFAMSIRENILFGKEDATAEEVVAAARAANAHNFISQLPQGYDTQVGERGIQMSGGQKQRIAIARAILRSPRILLLDEATSALDTESERVVQQALDAVSTGRTTVVVAHRLSTIRNSDTIVVMQSGEVKETGSHDELVADENGLYSSLVSRQISRDSEEVDVTGITSAAEGKPGVEKDMNDYHASPSMGDAGENGTAKKPDTVFGAIQPLYAYLLGTMLSVFYLADHDEIKEQTRVCALMFVTLAVLLFFLSVGQHYSFGVMGEHLTWRIRERMLAKILTFEVGWFDRDENNTGTVCSQLAKDATVVRSLVGDRMSLLIQTISATLISCTMALVIAWRLAIVIIAVQPFVIACFYTRRVLLKSMSKKSTQAHSECSKLAGEAVSNLCTISAFSSQHRILHLFEVAHDQPRKESIRQSWFAGLGLGTSVSLLLCSWVLAYWYGGKLMVDHQITAKALFQTFCILSSTGRAIADAGSMVTDLAKGADAITSVFTILDRESKIESNPEGYRPEALRGEVDIRGVDFAYPSRPNMFIYKGFFLNMQPGKSTALVGQSGSGKSTVIGLIERFYDPLCGVVKIDGRDIKTYNLRALRRHIGLVSQEPVLFAGTIRENIKYGTKATASEAEIENAARSANAHGFISNLKDGYDTWCGDRGCQLSGGQKQRIAIARAILKNPAILLLDEATSALDSQSEKVVQEALDEVMIGRTSLVVAHRLSTIERCDMIIVLDKGTVAEKGTHASLMAKGSDGTYFGLVCSQQCL